MSLSNKLAIIDLDLKDKRVLIRVNFNVPIDATSLITPALLVRFPPSSTPSTMELKP